MQEQLPRMPCEANPCRQPGCEGSSAPAEPASPGAGGGNGDEREFQTVQNREKVHGCLQEMGARAIIGKSF